MLKRLYILALLAAVINLTGCDADNEYNSTHRCYLFIDNSVRFDDVLNSCLNPMSPGTFCRISHGVKNGAQVFFLETNVNTNSEIRLLADDMQRSKLLGIYNESGLIVGYSNLPGMADRPELYAYDAICPNCYEANVAGCYAPMTFKGVPYGQCKCSNCNRIYNLNTGGNMVSGDAGKQLYRYRAETSGVNGYLKVHN